MSEKKNIIISKKKKCALRRAVEQLGYKWEEFIEEHIYIGGNKTPKSSYFYKCTVRYPQFNLIPPDHQEQCMCSTRIVEQCYIMNINTGNILVIGNCCIKIFDIDTKRYCDCGKALNNSKYQVCKYCRKKQETRLMFMKQEPSINENEKKETTEEYNKRINNLFIELCKNNKFLY
jgi:hypothetical protein